MFKSLFFLLINYLISKSFNVILLLFLFIQHVMAFHHVIHWLLVMNLHNAFFLIGCRYRLVSVLFELSLGLTEFVWIVIFFAPLSKVSFVIHHYQVLMPKSYSSFQHHLFYLWYRHLRYRTDQKFIH